MCGRVTYGHLRRLLIRLGFREERRAYGIGLEHGESDTIFLFRPYRDTDAIKPAEMYHVRQMLEARDLLDLDAFDRRLAKATS